MSRARRFPIRPAWTLALALLVPAALPSRALAWGFLGHRMVNRHAVDLLPPALRRVFEGNRAYITERAIDPDLFRSGPGDPDHFLDMDAFGAYPFDAISSVESEHLARFGKDAVPKGRVPWKVGEEYRALVEAMRRGDTPAVLARAGTLGHYIADAHVPLHAALNHDGQLTGQRGLHSRWESEMVERYERQIEPTLPRRPLRRVKDPVALTFTVLRESYQHSLGVLAADRESVTGRDLAETPEDERYDDGYYSRMFEREGARVRERLAAAIAATASVWTSAWEEAGRPSLDASYRVPYLRHGTRAILLSLDGSSAPILDAAVTRGVMPHLAALRAGGATATGSLGTLPPKTAASHAALYTGAWSDVNGISDNEIPIAGGRVTDRADGYSSSGLLAEPLWATAARQDLDVTVLGATQVAPFSTYFEERRFPGWYGRHLTLFDGYQSVETAHRVYRAADLPPRVVGDWLGVLPAHEGEVREVRLEDLGIVIDGLLFDDPADPARGFDTLYLGLDRDLKGGITLKPAAVREDASAFVALSLPLAGGDSIVYFRLFALGPDGADLLLYRTAAHVLRSNKPRLESAALASAGGFVGNGASHLYRSGHFGPPLWKGGDGTAEARYLETVALAIRQFERLVDFAIDGCAWELLFTYVPFPDEALHEWWGHLDPDRPGRDSALAQRLQPSLDRVLKMVDAHVGHLWDRKGEGTLLAVAGDHGQVSVDRVVRPNVALQRAGLLALDPSGEVDLARTSALYGPNFVLVNSSSRRGGIVKPEDEPALRRRIGEVLRAISDPQTGRPVILDVFEPGKAGASPSFGGPTGGDLYLSAVAGYFVSRQLRGELIEPLTPMGEHFLDPQRPAMQASFAIAGPGVAKGVSLGLIRQVDVAPTLAALLGIEPPAQSMGTVLETALARKAARPGVSGGASTSKAAASAPPQPLDRRSE